MGRGQGAGGTPGEVGVVQHRREGGDCGQPELAEGDHWGRRQQAEGTAAGWPCGGGDRCSLRPYPLWSPGHYRTPLEWKNPRIFFFSPHTEHHCSHSLKYMDTHQKSRKQISEKQHPHPPTHTRRPTGVGDAVGEQATHSVHQSGNATLPPESSQPLGGVQPILWSAWGGT